jgi:hypothetical protein
MAEGKTRKVWVGTPPTKCDICAKPIIAVFVDGKTVMGPWGNMCLKCHMGRGVGLGTGKGQRYELQGTEWVKTAG